MDSCFFNFTKIDLQIIQQLIIHSGEEFGQRDLARALSLSPTAIGQSIKRLLKLELVIVKKIKNMHFIRFNTENKLATQFKRAKNLEAIYISGLATFLEEKLAGATIILFGSYSRGEDMISSDIDIAVIGREKKDMDISLFEKKLKRTITIQYYNNWSNIHKHLRNNILNGITLSGVVDL